MLTFAWPISSRRSYTRKQTAHNIFSIFLTVTNCQLFLCTYTKHTYSLSGCCCPVLVLGPFLLGGGDTSTTSGDGGGTSTTPGDDLMDMTSSSLQHKIKPNQYTSYHSAQLKLNKVTGLPQSCSQTC